MFACSGNGNMLPIYVVFKAEHLYESWTVGRWFDQKPFEEWFERIALPYLKDQPPPRALIGDNLSSHFSYNVINLCNYNDIRFVALPKNSTLFTQPLDVVFFHPLKSEWRQQRSSVKSLFSFPFELKTLVENIKSNSSENIKSGFRKTGLIPLQRDEVLRQLANRGINANAADSSMEESFIGLLHEMHYGKDTEKKTVRRSRINVQPGKSVGNLDSSDSKTDTESSESCNEHEHDSTTSGNDAMTTDNAANKMFTVLVSYEEIEEGNYLLINLTCQSSGEEVQTKNVNFLQKSLSWKCQAAV
ncbi:hypothetical protein PR048_027254 [Dryococelus australis]|uniref:DDE-1 domain-containing protein n=1 Tax=Dryococelus australis TaxID=614101 RepID=A0ABQ9GEY4_9NEOP|nr:hypothetical protein PR048_027254 [Dryococelus australis]